MGCCAAQSGRRAKATEESTAQTASPDDPDGDSIGPKKSTASTGSTASEFCFVLRPLKDVEGETDGVSKASLIFDNPGHIMSFYELEDKLGSGTFGFVRRCCEKTTRSKRAVKAISKKRWGRQMERFRQEITIMKMLDHPNIIKLFETFEDEKNILLVMELCKGGDLMGMISKSGPFSEVTVAITMQQLFRPIHYMHGLEVVHRDIKPENFLLVEEDSLEACTLKLTDFGLSCKCKNHHMLSTKLGTPLYSSPQVLAGNYDRSCDVWSAGVIMYLLLSGNQPFAGKTETEVLAGVRRGNYALVGPAWEGISDDAKNLMRSLLKYEPAMRFTAEEALAHNSIRGLVPGAKDVAFRPMLVDQFRIFCSHNWLKRAALHIIAQQLGEEETRPLRRRFAALDTNGDGILSASELEQGLAHALDSIARGGAEGMTASDLERVMPDLQQLLEDMSAMGSGGAIGYTEFLAATLEDTRYTQEYACRTAFRVFDRKCNGLVRKEELLEVFDNTESVGDIMQKVDVNRDGYIDFSEFSAMMAAR